MFKKTLLALSIAGASLGANAGILSVDVNETAAVVTTGNNAGYTSCVDAAAAAGATLSKGSFTDNAAIPDAVTFVDGSTATGVYTSTANTAALTANDACTVTINADELVSADDAKYSQEGANAKGLTVSASLIAGVGGFSAEDTIVFTVVGGTVNEDASATALLNNGTDFTLLGVQGNDILFTVNSGVTAGTYGGRSIIELTGLVVTPTAGTDSISLSSYVQNTANVQYDSADQVEITKIAKQYSAKSFVLADGVIDVATERFDFETNEDDSSDKALSLNGAGEGLLTDTLVIEVAENTTQGNLTPKSGEIVIEGNFSWMKDLDADDDGKLSSTEIEAGFDLTAYESLDLNGALVVGNADDAATSGKASLNSDMTELTIPVTVNSGDLDKYYAVDFDVPGTAGEAEVSLETTKFMASVDFINDKSADTTTSDVDLNVTTDLYVGEWTLNGSVVEVPYIPFGPKTQPIIRHTNTGAQTGDISVRYMVEEGNGLAQTHVWKSLGVLVEDAEPGVRNLLKVITDALEAELGQDKFKVALEITTNVPGDDVTVYAAAKITAEGQDRLTIGAFKGN